MKQYLDTLRAIKQNGTYKEPAREGMPGTTSLFGYQFRHNLQEGFPILTTKKLSFKNIVVELLWFLRGDTNIKYLVDNGCNIWNEDAYNYYIKLCRRDKIEEALSFTNFIKHLKGEENEFCGFLTLPQNYTLGDCGIQYGRLWRDWQGLESKLNFLNDQDIVWVDSGDRIKVSKRIDQIKDLIKGLKENPMGRRHIITAWNPATLEDMALNACHALVQFNCRVIPNRLEIYNQRLAQGYKFPLDVGNKSLDEYFDKIHIPKYYLDCQMYQRSADVFLGVPYNIASYALLTEILSKICNMIPGDFIHTFGDVHIYDNHQEQVEEQLKREPKSLPRLVINDEFWNPENSLSSDIAIIEGIQIEDFELKGYDPDPSIKAKLSTGLK